MTDFIAIGKKLLKEGKFDEARDNFTAYITEQLSEREEALGYYWRAIAWQEDGNVEQAEIDFSKAERKRKYCK